MKPNQYAALYLSMNIIKRHQNKPAVARFDVFTITLSLLQRNHDWNG